MANTELPHELIPFRLLGYDYYLDQLTALLKKSYGIPEQIRMYVNILKMINNAEYEIFDTLGKYDQTEAIWKINIDKINSLDVNKSDILDKLGGIVGISRNYSFLEKPLNNNEMFCMIYAQIIRNNFDGSRLAIDNVYSLISRMIPGVDIAYYTSPKENATCQINLDGALITDSSGKIMDKYKNIYELFMRGYLAIQSIGIKYNLTALSLDKNGYFDAFPTKTESGETIYDTTSPHVMFDKATWN